MAQIETSHIEIGRGKSARRAFGLDEVSIVPSRRTRDDEDVDTTWRLDAFEFDVPLVTYGGPAAPGGLTVLDAEVVAGTDDGFDGAKLAAAVSAADDAGQVSAIAVRPQRAEQLIAALGRTEPDLLVIRGRVVSAEHVSRTREPLNLKKTVRSLQVPVVVGACSSQRAALHLMRTGAAAVIVASDPHSAGVGVPLATAIADVRAARMQHLDETGVYVHLIASVPVSSGGDIAKAVACGADAVLVEPVDGVEPATVVAELRRTMATCGYESVKELQSADLVVIA